MSTDITDPNNKLANPELLTDICTHVAIGGTLSNYCSEHEIHYKLLNRWIADDADRLKRYDLALSIREQHAKDLIIAELIAFMRAQPAEAFYKTEGGDLAYHDIPDMPAPLQRLIAGFEFEEIFEMQGSGKERERVHVGRMHKVKFWDKPRAIETFMKHLAMLVERKDLTSGGKSYAELIAESMKEEVKS